jgi:hypothetical protein
MSRTAHTDLIRRGRPRADHGEGPRVAIREQIGGHARRRAGAQGGHDFAVEHKSGGAGHSIEPEDDALDDGQRHIRVFLVIAHDLDRLSEATAVSRVGPLR